LLFIHNFKHTNILLQRLINATPLGHIVATHRQQQVKAETAMVSARLFSPNVYVMFS